ncbi:MAG: proton-conducting transporter membrane subunit [Angelakisella sp.]
MLMILCILLPVCGGIALGVLNPASPKVRERLVMTVTLLTSAAALCALWLGNGSTVLLLALGDKLTLALRADGLSKVFGTLVSLLWPVTTLYSFEYMSHEGGENRFFSFFTVTFGVVLGIALSENLFTLYLFYELMTFITLPLVMHTMDDKARYAGKTYLTYSMIGAAMAFAGLMIVFHLGDTLSFRFGGVSTVDDPLVRVGYLLAFFGFGVKAAVFPFHGWLPAASVAPTPVSALLHAVAVVKGGVFAILRSTYYVFGTAALLGSYAQWIPTAAVLITIVYGSFRALTTPHLKRRLAYSTISQLSYILLGALMMTPLGYTAALTHLVFHAVMKICLFFGAGAILYKTHREYLYEMDGLAKQMPAVVASYAVCAAALSGIPPLMGFISKWRLVVAMMDAATVWSYLGLAALFLSAVLTVCYMLFPLGRFYGSTPANLANQDPSLRMTVPMAGLAACAVLGGIGSLGLCEFFSRVAAGLL